MDDQLAWTMTINLYGRDFPSLQQTAKTTLNAIAKANSIKELPISGDAVGGPGDVGIGYNVSYTCPVESRIKQLRKEADELEASLKE